MASHELADSGTGQSDLGGRFAASLRGFGPIGLIAIAAILAGNLFMAPLGAILVLLWVWQSRVGWPAIGFSRPKSWPFAILGGAAIGILFKFAMKALVMPLLGAPAVNPAFHWIANNPAVLPGILVAVIFIAGFGEEILFRGYMFERLKRLLGDGPDAMVAIVGLTTILFALAHIPDQGIPGAQQAAFTGLAFALMYVFTGNLWLSIVAHASFDVAAVCIIYFDVEEAVARSIYG